MARYVHKPIVVDAVRFTGDNADEVLQFAGAAGQSYDPASGILSLRDPGGLVANVREGYWLARHEDGEIVKVAPNVFDATYDPAPDDSGEREAPSAVTDA